METEKKCALYGHPSAATTALSQALAVPIAHEIDSEISCAIFAINASSGIDEKTIQLWHEFDDFLMPRILIVTGFNEGLQDFDDAVLLAKRVLDDVAIGKIMKKAGVTITEFETLNIESLEYLKNLEKTIFNSIGHFRCRNFEKPRKDSIILMNIAKEIGLIS